MITQTTVEHVRCRVDSLSADGFVALVVDHLRCRTDFFDVQQGPVKGRDRGVDIFAKTTSATEDVRTVTFQCKHYGEKTALGVDAVKDTWAGLAVTGADEAVLVSNRDPTSDARELMTKAFDGQRTRISYQAWCGSGLAGTLLKYTPSILLTRFPELRGCLPIAHEHAQLCPSFEIVESTTADHAVTADSFYNGFPPSWHDLSDNHDIPRSAYIENGLRDQLRRLLTTQGVNSVVLLGVGGTGKTTLLRRAGFDSAGEGVLVLRLRDDWPITPIRLSQQLRDMAQHASLGLLVLIDDAADLAFDRGLLDRVVRELNGTKPIVLLMAEQPDRWQPALRQTPSLMAGQNYFPCYLHNLFPSECEFLVDRILAYETNGILSHSYCDLGRAERLALCHTAAERQLVVAMLQMRHGLQFRKIVEREYERIPMDEAKAAYALTCYMNGYSVGIPFQLLLRCFHVASPKSVQECKESTAGLFRETELGYFARHSAISAVVARYAFATPESRQAALALVTSSLNLGDEIEGRIFVRLFTGPNVYRRIVLHLDRKPELIRSLYSAARAPHRPPEYQKYVFTSEALASTVLADGERARAALDEALKLDSNYVFALRQYAWLEHRVGNWEASANLAIRAAALAPYNFLATYHCGRILSLNTVSYFPKAKKYLKRALELDPDHPGLLKSWVEYEEAELVLRCFSNLKDDEIVPECVYEAMRPGLAFIRNIHGRNSKLAKLRLKNELRQMQSETNGELGELYELMAGVDVTRSPVVQARFTCNQARLMYLEWYFGRESHNPDDIEAIFKRSLELDKHDPFTHCWYGTFLKETRSDFAGARGQYETAQRLGDKADRDYLHSHPLFLNNRALLIIDEVQLGQRSRDDLQEASELLKLAILRVEETGSGFVWPAHSLSLCVAIMSEESGQTDLRVPMPTASE